MADTADQLAWERQQRPRAAAATLLGAIAMIAGLVLGSVDGRNQPDASLLQSLSDLQKPGPIGRQPSVQIAQFEYLHDRWTGVIATALIALALVGIVLAVSFLGKATSARGPLRRWVIRAFAVGGFALALGLFVASVLRHKFYGDALEGPRTVDAVGNPATDSAAIGGIVLLALIAYSIGLIVVALNAMRVGLLPRAMGYAGILAGGFSILPPFNPAQPIIALWAAFLAPILIGRWIGGQPPAWETGQAEPWPSAAQQREERMKARGNAPARPGGRGRGRLAEPDPEPVEARAAAAKPHPSSKKRKRKRRS